MIDKAVEDLLDNFKKRTAPILGKSPVYALDDSWPSFGVIDLMCFGLRGKEDLAPIEDEFLTGASCYIGAIAHDCWSRIAEDVRLFKDEDEIVLTASGGSALPPDQDFSVRIKQQLRRLLRNVPQSLPVVADFVREGGLEYNYLSVFGIGLVTGLFPNGEGPWASRLTEGFEPQIETVVKALALSTAERYGRLHPDEQLGQVAELYLKDLIFPPTLMKEEWPVLAAARGIVEFAREYNVQPKSLQNLARNLALSPDERISLAGLCVYSAMCDYPPAPEVVAVAERRGSYMGLLRYAMVHVRNDLQLGKDWIRVDDLSSQNLGRYQVELLMGYIPWLKLSFGRLQQRSTWEDMRQLLDALAFFDFDGARQVCEGLVANDPSEIDLRVQLAYLSMVNNDIDAARGTLKRLVTEPGAERTPMLFNLWGLCDLLDDDVQAGLRHLRTAYQLGSVTPNERYQFTNNYAWALILAQQYEEALSILDLAISGSPCPLTSLLNKHFVLKELGKTDEALQVQSDLLTLAPLDVRVFGRLLTS